MRFLFRRRDPEAAYLDAMLWLPKRGIRAESMKAALEFYTAERGGPKKNRLWSETEHHLVCPRAFIPPENYSRFPFPFIDDRPREFEKTGIRLRPGFEYRDARQEKAVRAFLSSDGGIFNLGTGRGKTAATHVKIAHKNGPALVVVPNGGILDQWRKSCLRFLEISESDIGVIQEKRFEWDRPIVLAMIQTMAKRAQEGKIPPGFSRRFSLCVHDEVHHLGREYFSSTAAICEGERVGLTATNLRVDGTEFVYQFHLGRAFYQDTEVDVKPTGYFHTTDIGLTEEETQRVTKRLPDGQGGYREYVHQGKLISLLAGRQDFLASRAKVIDDCLARGKKVIALAPSVELLQAMHALYPESAFIWREVDYEERMPLLWKSQLSFVVSQLGMEAIDDVKLNALVALVPYKSEVWLPQSVGRLGRLDPDDPDKESEFHVLDDQGIETFRDKVLEMRKYFRDKEYRFHLLDRP